MSIEVAGTRGVRNVYGRRDLGYDVGVIKTEGIKNELSVGISGAMLNDIIGGASPLATVKIPAGSKIEEAYLIVDEAFDLGGTTPGVEVGTASSEATNGVSITEAQLESAGGYSLTSALSGTWDEAVLAAETTVGVAVSGTDPTSDSNAGKARLVVTYTYV